MRAICSEGCVCPPETNGLYCETLKFTTITEQSGSKPDLENENTIFSTNEMKDGENNKTLTISLAVLAAGLFLLGAVFFVMGRKTQPRRRGERTYQQETLSLKRIA